jgi:hypothetical protein
MKTDWTNRARACALPLALAACALGATALDAPSASAQPPAAPRPPTREEAQKGHEHKTSDLASKRVAIPRPVRVESAAEEAKMRAHVASRYAPQDVKHTFKHLGDDIDCVDIDKQPGARHPAMKGQRITPPPASLAFRGLPRQAPEGGPSRVRINPFMTGSEKDENGKTMICPQGTVPIRRLKIEELKAFKNMGDFYAKIPSHLRTATPHRPKVGEQPPWAYGTSSHEYAVATQPGLTNYGSHATLNIWDPNVGGGNEFSLAQTWVVGGGGGAPNQTLEVGWQVFPDKYGDNLPHLFVFSTQDGYAAFSQNPQDLSKGCYNLDCGQFQMVNWAFWPGEALGTGSVTGGQQAELDVAWVKMTGANGVTPGWWLAVNGTWIGYFPLSLYAPGALYDYANRIDFGGEIINNNSNNVHTTTGMGSGAYPGAGYGSAAYQSNIYYFGAPDNASATWVNGLQKAIDNPGCYDINIYGASFYFGGPGYNASCL